MEKPVGYDDATPKTFKRKPKAGGYIGFIKMATETLTQENPRPMLVLLVDISEGEHKNYFREKLDLDREKAIRDNKEAPKFKGVVRQTLDQVDRFKGIIQAIEDSNPGFKFDFDEKKLAGKRVGIVLGETEFNDEGATFLEVRYLTSVARVKAGTIEPPKLRKLNSNSFQNDRYDTGEPPPVYGGDVAEEDLPF